MSSIKQRRMGLKTAWRDLQTRARLGESFGFIDCIALLYKTGTITRQRVRELLGEHVTKEDLAEYRRVRANANCDTSLRALQP